MWSALKAVSPLSNSPCIEVREGAELVGKKIFASRRGSRQGIANLNDILREVVSIDAVALDKNGELKTEKPAWAQCQ